MSGRKYYYQAIHRETKEVAAVGWERLAVIRNLKRLGESVADYRLRKAGLAL